MKTLILVAMLATLVACQEKSAQDPAPNPEEPKPEANATKIELPKVDVKKTEPEKDDSAKVAKEKKKVVIPEGATHGTGYAVVFPKDWELKPKFMGTDTMALSQVESDTDTFQENVNIVLENTGVAMTPQQYFQASLAAMKGQLQKFKVVSDKSITLKSGEPAHEAIYMHQFASTEIKVRAVFVTRDKTGYVISASASPKDYPKWFPKFDAIVNSFVFKQ